MNTRHASVKIRRSPVAPLLVAAVIILGAAFPAAAQCNRVIENFWGYYYNDGTVGCSSMIFGPWVPPDLIGQRITECDGSVYEWGQRSFCYYEYGSDVTVEYEPCPGPCWDSQTMAKNVFQKGTAVALARWVSPAARRNATPYSPAPIILRRSCGRQNA